MVKAFLIILICLPSYLLADNTDRGFGSIENDRSEPISFSSDSLSFNQETGTSEMKGSVSIIQGDTVLSSDYAEVSFNVDTNELERFYASGNVVLKSGNDIARGNEAIYNFIENKLLFLKIFISSIPVMIMGYILVKYNVIDELRNIKIIAFTTLIFGVLLYISDKYKLHNDIENNFTLKSAIIIGVFQILSLIIDL